MNGIVVAFAPKPKTWQRRRWGPGEACSCFSVELFCCCRPPSLSPPPPPPPNTPILSHCIIVALLHLLPRVPVVRFAVCAFWRCGRGRSNVTANFDCSLWRKCHEWWWGTSRVEFLRATVHWSNHYCILCCRQYFVVQQCKHHGRTHTQRSKYNDTK